MAVDAFLAPDFIANCLSSQKLTIHTDTCVFADYFSGFAFGLCMVTWELD